MSNTLIIILIILYTIWCYEHEDELFEKPEKNLADLYRGPRPPQEKRDKLPHLQHPEPPHERIKVIREIETPALPSQTVQGKKFWKDRKVIVLFTILILGTLIIFFFNIVIATIFIFLMTMIIIFLRPAGINEAYPAAAGAIMILFIGVVGYDNLVEITHKIGGASITIIATIIMAVILESFGFFHWAAAKLSILAKGSGYRLYWYIQLLCFFMTMLFNNDGSILITTPIIILLLRNLQLKTSEQLPYLLSGALIATGSSTPIGVSNITNLISLNIINLTLYKYTEMIFIPGLFGLLFMSVLMFLLLKKRLPRTLPEPIVELDEKFFAREFHPFEENIALNNKEKRVYFMLGILAFVFGIRCLLFVASYYRIPIEIVAVSGSLILLALRWYYLRTNPLDIFKKTPWHILLFAFSMYVIIYGLNNIGLTEYFVKVCEPIVSKGLFYASFVMGGLMSLLSNIFNNHPALMIGTITLTNMGLSPLILKTIYVATIIGTDIGSLLLPIGTLASLIWMYILKRSAINVSWREYLKVTIIVIPLTVVFTLYLLYYWVQAVFI
ncbi:arsenic transporter [Clostridium sp. CX1]|uniref:arsenic transporter n=1 Tax=Clostridium sp. CX1 TaxID=2978346 RepID=UPI0021C18F65|nr:arsenic transporter [Clostridium sp. CX1]MCT8976616.1 arsenic transporter [Clostridium sp. CX1]